MSTWQPIETAPKSRLILAWMQGYETHSGVNWVRNGYSLMVMHDDGPAVQFLEKAIEHVMGPDSFDMGAGRFLEPTHWMPLPSPPEPEK